MRIAVEQDERRFILAEHYAGIIAAFPLFQGFTLQGAQRLLERGKSAKSKNTLREKYYLRKAIHRHSFCLF